MRRLLFALCLGLMTVAVSAKETVTIYYAFSPADTMANYSRSLVTEANRIQDKYNFVFDTKPGAGNTVAANFVKNTPNTILATSSAFFLRPVFFPNESYNVEDFKELMPQCSAPMGIVSAKFKSWREVPKDAQLNIGTSGLGVTTHVVASQIATQYPNMHAVAFKSTTDSLVSMAGGSIEFSVNFIHDAEAWSQDGNKVKVNVLGVTGDQPINGHPTLLSQGFPALTTNLSAPHHLVIPTSVSDTQAQAWRDILVKAAKSKEVRDSYAIDHCVPLSDMPDNQIQPWFRAQNVNWNKLSAGVKLK